MLYLWAHEVVLGGRGAPHHWEQNRPWVLGMCPFQLKGCHGTNTTQSRPQKNMHVAIETKFHLFFVLLAVLPEMGDSKPGPAHDKHQVLGLALYWDDMLGLALYWD